MLKGMLMLPEMWPLLKLEAEELRNNGEEARPKMCLCVVCVLVCHFMGVAVLLKNSRYTST